MTYTVVPLKHRNYSLRFKFKRQHFL